MSQVANLNSLSGCFPGALEVPVDTKTPDDGAATPTWVKNAQGYICIPKQSIQYTGGLPNRMVMDADGLGWTDTPGEGDAAGTSATDFRTFARGMHESWSRYTASSLTGVNAFTYWNETSGTYSVVNGSTLRRRYSTDIYYAADETLAIKPE